MSQNPYIQLLNLDPNKQNYLKLLHSFIYSGARARNIDRQKNLLQYMYGDNFNRLVPDENNNADIQYIFGEAMRALEGYMASPAQHAVSSPLKKVKQDTGQKLQQGTSFAQQGTGFDLSQQKLNQLEQPSQTQVVAGPGGDEKIDVLQGSLELPDKTGFDWLILNLLSHDFLHDFGSIETRSAEGKAKTINSKLIEELDMLLYNAEILLNIGTILPIIMQDSQNILPLPLLYVGGGERNGESNISSMNTNQETKWETKGQLFNNSNTTLKTQYLSTSIGTLMENISYILALQKEKGVKFDSVAMVSTLKTNVTQQDIDCDPTLKTCIKIIDQSDYYKYLLDKWVPLVEIPKSFTTDDSQKNIGHNNGDEDKEDEEDEEDDDIPTFAKVVAYSYKKIIERIQKIKPMIAKQLGLLALAPVFFEIVNTSIHEKNIVPITLSDRLNEILSKYTRDGDKVYYDGESIESSDNGMETHQINIYQPLFLKYIEALIPDEDTIDLKNLQDRIRNADNSTKKYIDHIILQQIQRAKKSGSDESSDIESNNNSIKNAIISLNELIPERVRKLEAALTGVTRNQKDNNIRTGLLKKFTEKLPSKITESTTNEELNYFKKFVLRLYHPDKNQNINNNQESIIEYFYGNGQEYIPGKQKGFNINNYVNEKREQVNQMINKNSGREINFFDIMPKPGMKKSAQIWNKFGGSDGLTQKIQLLTNSMRGGNRLHELHPDTQKGILKYFNSILIRTLILVLLNKTGAIRTNARPDIFFPHQEPGAEGVSYNNYYGYKPIFKPLFSDDEWIAITQGDRGVAWKKQYPIGGDEDFTDTPIMDAEGFLLWGNIYGIEGEVANPISLEKRKEMTRILFYNVQVLVLYFQLVKSTVAYPNSGNVDRNYFLQSLGLDLDTTKRSEEDIWRRGFGSTKPGKSQKEAKDFFLRRNTNKANYVAGLEEECKTMRQKYFGWLFGRKFSVKNTPFWFTGSPDDDIQWAFNDIVRKLLPEYVLTAGSNSLEKDLVARQQTAQGDEILEKDSKYITIEPEVNLPAPVECKTQPNCVDTIPIGVKQPDQISTKSKYIINNASQLHTTNMAKLGELVRLVDDGDERDVPRFGGFYNLDAMQARYAQFCPTSSIADGMSLCSPGTELTTPSDANINTQESMVLSPISGNIVSKEGHTTDYYHFNLSPEKTLRDWSERPSDINGQYTNEQCYNTIGEFLMKTQNFYNNMKAYSKANPAMSAANKNAKNLEFYDVFFGDYSVESPVRIALVKEFWDILQEQVGKRKFSTNNIKNGIITPLEHNLVLLRDSLMKIKFSAKVSIGGDVLVNLQQNDQSLLGDGPFSAVGSYIKIIEDTANVLNSDATDASKVSGISLQRDISTLLQENISYIFGLTIKKSMGDYSQEISTVAKFGGAGDKQAYIDSNNRVMSRYQILQNFPISINYNDSGNAFRLFVANDRPSGMRALFLVTQLEEGTYNEKAVSGFYTSKYKKKSGSQYTNEEKQGKGLLVKGNMVIPGELPKFYSKKWGPEDTRLQRIDFAGQQMVDDVSGEPIYGYNETELDRWNESKSKSTVNNDGTNDGAKLNVGALAGVNDGNGVGFGGFDDGNGGGFGGNDGNGVGFGGFDDGNGVGFGGLDDGGKGGNSINIKDKGYTISFGGGKRKKTRKRNKRISRNNTTKRHKI